MLDDPRYRGLLHLCNSGSCTWQAYGQATLDLATELGAKLKAHTVDGASRKSFPAFKAERPEFTAFDTTKYQQLSGITPRHWRDALKSYLRQQLAEK
jgi:dTDP-4-dehydrorhamnose reductase